MTDIPAALWHSLRIKTLAFLSVLLGMSFALALWLSSSALEDSFDRFERGQLEQDVARIEAVFGTELESLKRQARDYAWWDDSYAFSREPAMHRGFLADNFAAASMQSVDLDQVLMLRADGRILLDLSLDTSGTAHVPQSGELTDFLRALLGTLAASPPQEGLAGLVWLDGTPLLLAVTPVRSTDRKAAADAYLALGRRLSAQRLAKLAKTTAVQFSLLPQRGPRDIAAPQLSRQDDQLEIRHPLTTLGELEPALLRVHRAAGTRDANATSQYYLLANTALIFGLALLGALLSLDRLVLRRLRQFERLAREYHHGKSELAWPVTGNDELDRLAKSLNGLVATLAQAQLRLAESVLRDGLTGLGNRAQLMERLQFVLSMQARHRHLHAALFVLDLDNFQLVNENLGHAAGDALLKAQAQRIQQTVRQSDLAVRLEGDSFAILYLSADTLPDWAQMAEQLRAELAESVTFRGVSMQTTASLGLACMEELQTAETWLKVALFAAKAKGKARTVAFEPGLADVVGERQALEHDLRLALETQALELWYQPIMDVASGRPHALEALIRWRRPEGFCPPDRFIPVAEASDLIVLLGRYTLAAGCRALTRFREAVPELELNINISARQLFEPGLVGHVLEQLHEHGLPRDAVHLELTETLVINNEDSLLPPMQALADAGLSLHLDDFGTGYSSLGRLEALPISTIKLDRSFVRSMNEGRDAVARIVLLMARELKLDAIAEGVETAEDRDRLLAMGCGRMQGYFFAKPMPEAAMRDWLQTWAGR